MSVYPGIKLNSQTPAEWVISGGWEDSADGLTVHVALDEDGDAAEYTCSHCGRGLDHYPGATPEWASESDREAGVCREHPDYGDVHVCGIDCDTKSVNDNDAEGCGLDAQDMPAPHDPQLTPLQWANSAAIITDPAQDSVQVAISAGDARGAFTMTVRRIVDEDTGEVKLFLYVPYADMNEPHMRMVQVHPGSYRLGNA